MKPDRLKRLMQILMTLQAGKRYTADDLSRLFGTCRRTVFRDLKELQAVGVSYHYDPVARAYDLDIPSRRQALPLDRQEALGLLLLAHRASSQMHLPFRRSAVLGALKVEGSLPADVRRFCGAAMECVSSRDLGQGLSRDLEALFAQVQSAIVSKRVIRVRYGPGVYAPVEDLELWPLHLYYDHPTWYLFAQTSQGRHVEPLKLCHILDIQVLDRCFVANGRFDLVEVLGRAWSTRPEGQLYHVKLRFLPKVADQVTETRWHSSQQVTGQPDGSAIVEFRVDGLNEITWWVLGYGDQVQVLAPAALLDRVVQAARNMIRLNSANPNP